MIQYNISILLQTVPAHGGARRRLRTPPPPGLSAGPADPSQQKFMTKIHQKFKKLCDPSRVRRPAEKQSS